MLPSELLKRMTHREYRTLIEHYNEKSGRTHEKKRPATSSGSTTNFGPPVYEPLNDVAKAQLLWKGRLKIEDKK